VYKVYGVLREEGPYLLLEGRVVFKEDEAPKIIADRISSLKLSQKESLKKLYLKVGKVKALESLRLKKILLGNPGEDEVLVYVEENQRLIKSPDHLKVRISDGLIRQLKDHLGEDAVVIK
jgi:hypothetical protein